MRFIVRFYKRGWGAAGRERERKARRERVEEAAEVGPSLLCKQVANETTQTSKPTSLLALASTVKLLKMKWALLS